MMVVNMDDPVTYCDMTGPPMDGEANTVPGFRHLDLTCDADQLEGWGGMSSLVIMDVIDTMQPPSTAMLENVI